MTDPVEIFWSKYDVQIIAPSAYRAFGIEGVTRFRWLVMSREDHADIGQGTAPTYTKAMAAAKRWLDGREA